MKKPRVGDIIRCTVETRPSGYKYVQTNGPNDNPIEVRKFQIIRAFAPHAEAEVCMYTILLDDDLVGFTISDFHVNHQNVAAALRGKKFWDIHFSDCVES